MFKGIEGARAWLAWAVVFSHIIQRTALSEDARMRALGAVGTYAVLVFIVISGFVITNLILTKQESYGAYITRRALRIYPAYLVALALGAIVTIGFADVAARYDLHAPHFNDLYDQSRYFWQAPAAHFLLHLSLLHGVVPNEFLQNSQYMFVPPAWSLSLEFQFYLLAPFVLIALKRWPGVTVAAIAGLEIAYAAGVFGTFQDRSLIFGAGWYFLLGIGTRLFMDRLPTFDRFPWGLALAVLFIGIMDRKQVPLSAWLCLVIYMRSGVSAVILDGKVPQFFGARSYSVYILHMPVIMAAAMLCYGPLHLGGWSAIVATGVITVVVVAALSEIVYRWIEMPAIRFGKRLGREPSPAVAGW